MRHRHGVACVCRGAMQSINHCGDCIYKKDQFHCACAAAQSRIQAENWVGRMVTEVGSFDLMCNLVCNARWVTHATITPIVSCCYILPRATRRQTYWNHMDLNSGP